MRSLRILTIGLLLVLLSLTFTVPALAQDGHDCSHSHEPTIEGLITHINHAVEMEHITNPGVANALLSQLNAAQAALDRGQAQVAINILQATSLTIEAQSGKTIEEPHGSHLVNHVQSVISALSEGTGSH